MNECTLGHVYMYGFERFIVLDLFDDALDDMSGFTGRNFLIIMNP